jgi:ABC-type phosphate/phosphonate transport system substrate-binding protein
MYDIDPAAVQAWWSGIAAAMRAEGIAGVPRSAIWPADLDAHWHDPRLLLSQTCGYPLVTRLKGVVQVVGAFCYTAPGCWGNHYRSELLARQDEPGRSIEDFRGRVAAINDRESHSGCNALRALVAPLAPDGNFFAREVVSGSHRGSLALLRSGKADVAAIDCVSLAAMRRHAPELVADLHVIGSTASAPGLPLVTSANTPSTELRAMRRALTAASMDPRLADVRDALFIEGFEVVPATAWSCIADMAAPSDHHRSMAVTSSDRRSASALHSFGHREP